jgi:hypothetical protein
MKRVTRSYSNNVLNRDSDRERERERERKRERERERERERDGETRLVRSAIISSIVVVYATSLSCDI